MPNHFSPMVNPIYCKTRKTFGAGKTTTQSAQRRSQTATSPLLRQPLIISNQSCYPEYLKNFFQFHGVQFSELNLTRLLIIVYLQMKKGSLD